MKRISAEFNCFAVVLMLCLAAPLLTGCPTVIGAAAAGGAGVAIGSDSRTINRMMYDEQIEMDVNNILSDHRSDSDSKIFRVEAVAYNGNVLLMGQTTNTEYLKLCVDRITKVDHVYKIYNYVKIKEPVSSDVITSDSFITTKVKAALLMGDKISSGRFKICTEDSDVFMLGYVTRDEANRAVNQASKISGIRTIYRLFDYMDVAEAPAQVTVVDGYGSNGAAAVSAPAPAPAATAPNSSSFAAEARASADNGGAMIVEDSNSDLLAPATPANW